MEHGLQGTRDLEYQTFINVKTAAKTSLGGNQKDVLLFSPAFL